MIFNSRDTLDSHDCSNDVIISSLYPLGGNYGGIMQAYALQRVIAELGFEPKTIDSPRSHEKLRYAARLFRYLILSVARRTIGPPPLTPKQTLLYQNRTRGFVDSELTTIDLFSLNRRELARVLSETRAIVVGSDQVWRGGYASIPDQLLRYAVRFPLKKFSYAASFGADELVRFSPRMRKKSRDLASLFSAISVREESGVRIAMEAWGRIAEQHVDPTLLLPRSTYVELTAKSAGAPKAPGKALFVYVIDTNDKVNSLIEKLSVDLDLDVVVFPMDPPPSGRTLAAETRRFQMRSVEEWLLNFHRANFIVTDSFHGTVFSIIFNKPFISIGNRERGLARFESLLSLFDLEDRLIDIDSDSIFSSVREPDWAKVAEVLERERQRALSYLRDCLGDPHS